MLSKSSINGPKLPADFTPNSFADAIKVTGTGDPSVFTADLKRDWAIGLGMLPFSFCLELRPSLFPRFPPLVN